MGGMSRLVIPALLIVAVLMSAIALVYNKHQSRKLFVELQHLKQQVTELNIEWGQLQLEQSAWTDHGRIERIARERLLMKQPVAEEVIFIKP